jgi:hypothetical protein
MREVRNNRDDACGCKRLTQGAMPRAVAGETVRQYRNAIGWIGARQEDIDLHFPTIEARRFGVLAE